MKKELPEDTAKARTNAYMKSIAADIEKLKARIDRGIKKYNATHTLIGEITPHNGRYRPGTPKQLFPAFRWNPETQQREMVRLQHVKYTGWDYGKNFTTENLAEKRRLADG